jgi:hypothetical protein
MGPKKFDPLPDLIACPAMAEEFEAYLKSDVLYWQMDATQPGGDQLPKLTIGGFLERARRLRAAPLAAAQRDTLDKAVRQFELVRDVHRPRYVMHALHDLRGRLNAWTWFLDDYTKRPNEEAAYYPAQAHTRLAIELLLDELMSSPIERIHDSEATKFMQHLSALDERLRADWIDGDFVWDDVLSHAFPREQFWWLYGQLRVPDKQD